MAPATVPTPPASDAAADNGGGDHQQFGERAFGIGGGVEPRNRNRAADPGQQAHQHKELHDRPARVDAGKLDRLAVAADGVNVTSETRARREEGHGDADADGDEYGNGYAMRNKQPAGGQRDLICFRITAHAADRPRIGIGDRHRAEDQQTGNAAEEDFRRHRPQRKVKLLAPGAGMGLRQQQR